MGYRPKEYDHIVVGAGAVGTSTAYHLSGHAGRTLVLERFYENHALGSSHGRTRILRTAYAEGSAYVPLVLRARRLWIRLGREAGEEIFRSTGVLLAARSNSVGLRRARGSAHRYGLSIESFDPEEARERFPAFHLARGDAALWDPAGGVLFPERAIRAYRRLAHGRGVDFRWKSPVTRWRPTADGRILVSTRTREYLAGSVILTAGAWLPTLIPSLHLPLEVEQQTVFWFRAKGPQRAWFRAMPAFVWYSSEGGYFYGTPDLGDGVKIGGNDGQRVRDLDRRPPPSMRELRSVQRFLSSRLPGLPLRPRRQARCLYTNTPDKNFIVDFHPDSPNVLIVSACSGHGFKFASAMGELIARGVNSGTLPHVLVRFKLSA